MNNWQAVDTQSGFGWKALRRTALLITLACALFGGGITGQQLWAQAITTTTVQGTVYLASGAPASGTLIISWPSFTTAAGQSVAADSTTVTIGADGFVSVNLAPNLGATPAGLYYTVVYQLSDGTVNTEYWVVPATTTATIASVEAQVLPAAQAVQAATEAYVNQQIAALGSSQLSPSGGTLTGPLTLSGDPTTPLMAADKHYVDQSFAQAVPLAGGTMTGPLATPAVNGLASPVNGSAQTNLQTTVTAAGNTGAMIVPPTYSGTDSFTNPGGIRVEDWRTGGSQQHPRSVKEFGAVCDGVTDDTAALQAAINYAQAHHVGLTLPSGICKTHPLTWHLESIAGQGTQNSALMGFPGQDILVTTTDSPTLFSGTRLHDFTLYVDQSVDVSCSPAEGRAAAGSCTVNRPVEGGSIFSPGGNGLTATAGSGAGWYLGNCAIAMPASTGAGGNGLKNASIDNLVIATTGNDPLGGYSGASSTHTCGLYLAQWPAGSVFRNLTLSGLGTGIAVPALPATVPAGLTADNNQWSHLTLNVVHGFVAAVGANNVLDGITAHAWNSAATGEAPTGLVLDFAADAPGTAQGWTIRNARVSPEWIAVQPQLAVNTASGAVTGVTVGPEHGLGFEPYGPTVPLVFSGSCTAVANASVNADGSLGTVAVTSAGFGCSSTTTATINVAGTWMTAKPVNLISGQKMTLLGGAMLNGSGGYTVWNAASSETHETSLQGGGTLAASTTSYPALVIAPSAELNGVANGNSGSSNRFQQLGLSGAAMLADSGLGNVLEQTSGAGQHSVEPARLEEGRATADFALLGGGSANQAFSSLDDLFLTAEDLLAASGESVGTGSQSGKDASAPVTGSYVRAVGGAWDTTGNWSVRGAGGSLLLGNGFPVGTGTWEIAAKADTAASQELKLSGVANGQSCVFADQTVNLTTSWQIFRIPYNTVTGISACDSATQGNAVNAQGMPPSTSTNVETAWMAFVPAFQQLLVANAPTAPEQAANKAYVDQAVASQIASGSGELPLAGGTMTGALNAPVIDGTTNCALSPSVSGCVSSAASALIPPGTTGTFAQNAAMQATAQCVYDPTQNGAVTSVIPGQLGQGYTVDPLVTVSGGGGSGLQVTANLSNGEVSSYTVTSGGSGYTSCPTIAVAPPSATKQPAPVLDQRRGVTTYSADIRVDDFGCAGDGVTDDTQCFNNAIEFATGNGTHAGSVTLTQGKTYFIGTITGYMQTAWDDGTAPSTDTCNGVPCTNLSPETPGYLGYAIRIPSTQSNSLTIYGNGATITSSFTGNAISASQYTMAAPYFAIFGSDTAIASWNLYDLNISQAFIAATTVSAAYWQWDRVTMNGVGMALLLGSSQFNHFRNLNLQGMMSGLIIGGWWKSRAPGTSIEGNAVLNDYNLGDGTSVDGIIFYGFNWSTQAQSQTAQNALDTWFNTYFFHEQDNQTRLTDQNKAPAGGVMDSLWRGVYHVMFATYSRYYRPVIGVYLHDANIKFTQNYPIIATAATGWTIDSIGTELVGWCDATPAYGAYGSSGCPNPYDSVDNQLMGAVLLYDFQNMTARNINVSGSPIADTVAEPPQVSQTQQLGDFRTYLTNTDSIAASVIVPRTAPVTTLRLSLGHSTGTGLPGEVNFDSGEFCLHGSVGGYDDAWCMRNADGLNASMNQPPRYFVLENDGFVGLQGLTAVQMPGLRVRPGVISTADATLPVTDFAEQAFAIAGGTVRPQSCATVPGITLPNAAATDGILYVAPPASVNGLQLSGTMTAAGTMALTACNPTTNTASYPAGTYQAFLLAGAASPTPPTTSGGAVTTSGSLTQSEGDLVVGDANGNPTRLAGNSSTTPALLVDVGNGTGAFVPTWQTAPQLAGGNLTGLNASNVSTGTLALSFGGTGAADAAQALANLGGASLTAAATIFSGTLTAKTVGGLTETDQESGANFGAQLAACIGGLPATGGTCDARNYTGAQTISAAVTVSVPNTRIDLPCATITMTAPLVIPAGVRGVKLHGCALRGGTAASGMSGGTVLAYSGAGAAIQVGDSTYAQDTMGFAMDNVLVNTTGSTSAATEALAAWRVQELDLESDYYLGNANQTALQLDGTGNYTGGTFFDQDINGFQIAVNAVGHQVANAATTDWVNASTFLRLHIDCPTASGSAIAGTVGVNLVQGDGNTFTGGDVEGCSTAVHLGSNAQNNTLVGVRNEGSTTQVEADAGSQFNSWMTGGTMFTGALIDNGSRNSFWDAFHRTFNGLNGDWYASQKDATVTNHYRLGTGAGNVRGLEWESQVDNGTSATQYNWLWGLTDGGSGQSNWIFQDLINGVIRLQMEEQNAAGNNSTAINGTGTGNVCFQCSGNAGTGGVAFSSGGASPTTVATVDGSGNADFLGTLAVGGATTFTGSTTVKNAANAEIDQTLQAGATTTQKESFIYKDYTGASQWYMVKDGSNNWALNSAIDGLDHLKAYQNGDEYLDAAGTGAVRFNVEANAGTGGVVFYSGGATPTTVAKIDGSGNLTVASCTGCGATSGGAGTVASGTAGQLAYYATTGTTVSGLGTTGTGSAVLATSPSIAAPTLTGTTTATGNVNLTNATNAAETLAIQPGTSAEQNGTVAWNSYTGATEWTWKKDSGNALRMTDAANSMDRIVAYQNGQTAINAGAGANAVTINNGSGSGTGGLIVYEGGSNANTAAMTVTGAGDLSVPGTVTANLLQTNYGGIRVNAGAPLVLINGTAYATATQCINGGFVSIQGFYWNGSASAMDAMNIQPSCMPGTNGAETLNLTNSGSTGPFTVAVAGAETAQSVAGSGGMTLAAGTAAGTGATIGCASGHVCDGVSGTLTLTTGTATTTGTVATLTFPFVHVNNANCVVNATLAGSGAVNAVEWSETTTALTLTADAALTAGTGYSVRYWCGGN